MTDDKTRPVSNDDLAILREQASARRMKDTEQAQVYEETHHTTDGPADMASANDAHFAAPEEDVRATVATDEVETPHFHSLDNAESLDEAVISNRASFDPDVVLKHWSPAERDTYWKPALQMNTRVTGVGAVRLSDPSRSVSRTRVFTLGILVAAALVAAGLFFIIQQLDASASDNDETVTLVIPQRSDGV